jgi:DNA-binding transcriptional ArsR family regulator
MTQESDDADRLWAALGDPMRLRLLNLLLERDEATASALATTLPITRQGVAKHLTVLERAGLVKARRAGRELRFTVRDDRLDQARRQMAQIASRWDKRLAAIKHPRPGAAASRSPARAIAPPHSIFGSAAEAVIRPGTVPDTYPGALSQHQGNGTSRKWFLGFSR